MRVIFMGTPDFAVGTLEALIAADAEVVLVVTQPDKPQGRKMELTEPPVKVCAKEHGLEVYQPNRVRQAESVAYLQSFKPDMIVVAAFGQILPKEILEMPKYGCINVHASLLPKYRGSAPIQWSILNGDAQTGVTIMRMDEGIDTGDMIAKTVVDIDPEDTGGSLFDKLSIAGARLLVDTIPSIVSGEAVYTRQEQAQATKVGMIQKSQGIIDFSNPARVIDCQIRALNPWPSAFTKCHGKTLKIWKAKALDETTDYAPGQVARVSKEELCIATGCGLLSLKEVQLEGKKRMAVADFLRGNALQQGEQLG